MTGGSDRISPLDRPIARLAAVAIALAGLALLGWFHREGLRPPQSGQAPASPAEATYRACAEPRTAQLAAAAERGELTEEQAALFRRRAEAFCADRANKGRLPASSAPGEPR